MKVRDKEPAAAADAKKTFTILSRDAISRREFLVGSAAAIAAICLTGPLSAAADGKKTFTILHTNDMHTSFIGMGPAADYTPFALNDDATLGGYARLAAMIAKRKAARQGQGPVLVLDAGDYSMGTAFAAATREIGGELKLMGMMGYDATTFGNHEFDLGPDGLGRSITCGRQSRPDSGGAPLKYRLYQKGHNAGRPAAPGQGWRGPPLRRHRTGRHPLRHLRSARQGGHALYQWRCGHVRRPHRDRQRDSDASP